MSVRLYAKCANFIRKCNGYYKMSSLLQNASAQTSVWLLRNWQQLVVVEYIRPFMIIVVSNCYLKKENY